MLRGLRGSDGEMAHLPPRERRCQTALHQPLEPVLQRLHGLESWQQSIVAQRLGWGFFLSRHQKRVRPAVSRLTPSVRGSGARAGF